MFNLGLAVEVLPVRKLLCRYLFGYNPVAMVSEYVLDFFFFPGFVGVEIDGFFFFIGKL